MLVSVQGKIQFSQSSEVTYVHPFILYIKEQSEFGAYTKDTLLKMFYMDILQAFTQYDEARSTYQQDALNKLSTSVDYYVKQLKNIYQDDSIEIRDCETVDKLYFVFLALINRIYIFMYSYMKASYKGIYNYNGKLDIIPSALRLLTKELPKAFESLVEFVGILDRKYCWTDLGYKMKGIDDIVAELIIATLVLICKNNVHDSSGLRDAQYYVPYNNIVKKTLNDLERHPDYIQAVNKALFICEAITTYDILGVYYKRNYDSISNARIGASNANFWINNFFIRLSIKEAIELIAAPKYAEKTTEIVCEGFPFGYPDKNSTAPVHDLLLRSGVTDSMLNELADKKTNNEYKANAYLNLLVERYENYSLYISELVDHDGAADNYNHSPRIPVSEEVSNEDLSEMVSDIIVEDDKDRIGIHDLDSKNADAIFRSCTDDLDKQEVPNNSTTLAIVAEKNGYSNDTREAEKYGPLKEEEEAPEESNITSDESSALGSPYVNTDGGVQERKLEHMAAVNLESVASQRLDIFSPNLDEFSKPGTPATKPVEDLGTQKVASSNSTPTHSISLWMTGSLNDNGEKSVHSNKGPSSSTHDPSLTPPTSKKTPTLRDSLKQTSLLGSDLNLQSSQGTSEEKKTDSKRKRRTGKRKIGKEMKNISVVREVRNELTKQIGILKSMLNKKN